MKIGVSLARGWVCGLAFSLWLAAALAGGEASAQITSRINATDVRLGAYGNQTRFILDLSGPVDARIFTLTDDYRLVIDTPEINWNVSKGQIFAGTGLIRDVRFARNKPGYSRIVLDLNNPVRVVAQNWLQRGQWGVSLVLDLAPTDPQTFAATSGFPNQRNFGEFGLSIDRVITDSLGAAAKNRNQKKVVVIDPGHGGFDPGAIGETGIQEKDVVLAMAKELKAAILARGGATYEVHLTRETDVYVKRLDRVKFARDRKADLFVSIHADANPDHSVRGTSVYTLDENASDEVAARLADQENAVNGLSGEEITDDVLRILIDLAQRDTLNHSAKFARILLPKLNRKGINLLNNPHRFGPFTVLTAPEVPSVLIELGFQSNPADARLVASAAWRKKMALGLAEGITAYFEETMAMADQAPR